MSATITNDSFRDSKPVKYMIPDKIVSSCGFHLNPFGHIINNKKDIKIAKKRRKWTHKINTPNIKNFTLKNIC